jgi:hypothetical protein
MGKVMHQLTGSTVGVGEEVMSVRRASGAEHAWPRTLRSSTHQAGMEVVEAIAVSSPLAGAMVFWGAALLETLVPSE